MAKLIIDNNQIAEAFFEDARLLGIQCPVEPHRFVWMVNRAFGYHFQYQPDGEIKLTSQKRDYQYPVYRCQEENMELFHLLYVNEDDGKNLLPELKHIDFLWLMKGELPNEAFLQTIMRELRALDSVQLVLELTNEKIRNKEHLVT
ncbi:MAG TPA: IPExxxVDY family protein [Phnomibacter sp.]|nr:IPExxxVDY family protein [Phnomibacter sp.]